MHTLNKYDTTAIALMTIGLVLFIATGTALADTYTYDQYGRLTGVTYSDGSSVTYTYDAAGNRIVASTTSP